MTALSRRVVSVSWRVLPSCGAGELRSSLSLRQREFNNISLIFFGTHCLVQALFKIPSFVLITLLFSSRRAAIVAIVCLLIWTKFGHRLYQLALYQLYQFYQLSVISVGPSGRQEPADDRAGLPGPEDGESQPPAAAANTEPQPCQPPVTASDGGSDVEEELPMDEW